jgi:hypothetical protein
MVLNFTAKFAITTEPWNYSYTALKESKEIESPGTQPFYLSKEAV